MNIVITGVGRADSLGYMIAKRFVKGLSHVSSSHHIIGINDEVADDAVLLLGRGAILCDVSEEVEVATTASWINREFDYGRVDILVNCAGVHSLEYIEDVRFSEFERVMRTNAGGILNMTQALLPLLKLDTDKPGTVLNILSTASDIPMTASLSYSASKGAAKIMTLQMARELGIRHGICVFGISPNKLHKTGMSKQVDKRVMEVRGWDEEYMVKYGNSNILCGYETPPEELADFIYFLLQKKSRHGHLAGTIIPYGQQR